MDELKSKVLKFVKKQNSQPFLSESTSHDIEKEIRNDFIINNRDTSVESDPIDESQNVEDDKILEDIDPAYFCMDESVDIKQYQLKKLPEVLDCNEIKRELKMLYRQHTVVSKKLLRLILEQESSCKKEFEEILGIEEQVSEALNICKCARKQLQSASEQFTIASLGILSDYKRKQVIFELLRSLKSIKTLQQTDNKLQELLHEENFPGAISLLQECQLVASNFNHFRCVAQLNSKLSDTLYLTKEQLDIALSKICKRFNLDIYSKLQEAYRLLDDTETVMDQLLMHFTSEIHNACFNTVHRFSNAGHDNLKLQFQQLCKSVPAVSFIVCLQNLCQNLWHIINSYFQVVQWHQNFNKQLTKSGIPSKDVKMSLTKQHIKQKLENGLCRLWTDIESKICIYLSSHNLAVYKFEELLQILSIIHKLIEIGEEFCNSKSEELQNSVRQQSINYFKNYHHLKLEELRIFLENESWTLCPVKPRFTLLHLQEFKTLRNTIENYRKQKYKDRKEHQTLDNQNGSSTSVDGSSTVNGSYFVKYQDSEESPFDVIVDDSVEEDILADIGDELSGYFTESSEDSENDELKKDFVEETPVSTEKNTSKKKVNKHELKTKKEATPLLANTTLTVMRHCGKYLQMCRLLKPIALDVIICMCQLFDYYLYNIYIFFANDLPVQSASMFSFKLQATIKRIEDNLIINASTSSEHHENRVVTSTISSTVNLSSSESLYGLTERMVAVESLIFLASQFEYIQPFLLHLIPDQKKHFLQHFYAQTVSSVVDLRRPTYMSISAHVIDMKSIIKEMSKVNFEIKDVVSEHSPYVDKIVRELQIFSMRLEELDIYVPQEVYSVLWENVVHIVNNTFVEGFSNVKKCSNGGRALMQLDYTQFLSKLEKITTLRPIPNREYVDLYVKSYYLQETNLEEWIKQHKEYSPKQLEALVHCACQNNRKRKQKLLSILEGTDK